MRKILAGPFIGLVFLVGLLLYPVALVFGGFSDWRKRRRILRAVEPELAKLPSRESIALHRVGEFVRQDALTPAALALMQAGAATRARWLSTEVVDRGDGYDSREPWLCGYLAWREPSGEAVVRWVEVDVGGHPRCPEF